MKRIFSILLALALVLGLSLVAVAPVSANPADGDVTIVVQDQAGNPVAGATATLLFYGGGKGGYSMDGKTTDGSGSATFNATEIATWLTTNGYNATSQIYVQPGAKVETTSAYGRVRTVDPTTGFPCIPYNTPGGTLVPKPAMSFTYNMIMMSTEPVETVWNDPGNNFTVTATLAESLSVTPDVTRIRLIRNLVGGQSPAPGGSDDDWYMWNGTAYERWKGIATVNATATGSSVSATFSQGIFSDWQVGNKVVVRAEFGLNRTVDSVSCIDDYYSSDILRPSSYIHPAQINDSTLFYPTIQDAINAASASDTIYVSAGTYDEQLVTTKSLALQGAGDTTIIKPSSAAKLTQVLTGLFWFGGTKNIAGIIVANVADGSSVTIKNLKVDESLVTTKPTGADYLAGIFYRETGGLVDTVTVAGTGVWSGSDRAYGIYLSAGTNSVSVEIKDSSITNFDKNGMEVMGNTLAANIHHNTITGRGSITDEVQNGVNVGRDAVATVDYNTISDLVSQPETYWAAGIMFYHYVSPTGKNATANNNIITNCQIGIIFKNANGLAQGNTVSGGTVGLIGIYAEPDLAGTWTASFVGNTVSGVKDSPGYENAAIGANTYDAGATLTVTIDNNQLASGSASADGIVIGDSTAGSTAATITDNTISGWQYGIRLSTALANAASSRANNNNIFGNSVYGVSNNGTGTLDATVNWWGDASGPGGVGPGTGDNVSANVTFQPWLYAEVAASKTETVTNGTVDATDEADTEVAVTGTGTVNVVKYAGNPGGTPSGFTALGKYIDVYVPDTSGVTSLEIRAYYTDDEAEGFIEESLLLYWSNSTAWVPCSNSGVNTASNYIWAIVTNSTTPSLDDLEGTPFGGGGSAVPTVTTLVATAGAHSAGLGMSYTVGDFSSVQVRFAYKRSDSSEWYYTDWVSKDAAGTHSVGLTRLSGPAQYDFKAQLMYDSTLIEGSTLQFAAGGGLGCFIATAAYGTPTAKQIDVLREFRDDVLLKTTVGSEFVDLYYQLSPPAAEFIAGHEALRTLVRELMVDPIVWVVEATGNIWRN
jgi:hypothetical protein